MLSASINAFNCLSPSIEKTRLQHVPQPARSDNFSGFLLSWSPKSLYGCIYRRPKNKRENFRSLMIKGKLTVPQYIQDNYDLSKPTIITETRTSKVDGVSPILVMGLAYKSVYFEECIPFSAITCEEDECREVKSALDRLVDQLRPILNREDLKVVQP